MDNSTVCQQFAGILQGTILDQNPCTVMRMRNLSVEIMGRPTRSGLALAAMFSFESPDALGRTLNLGETVILPEEINPFISALRERGIMITALHNHWLFDDPRIMFIHFDSVEEPLAFALKVAEAFRLLRS